MFNVLWSTACLLVSLCATVAASRSAAASSSSSSSSANLTHPPPSEAVALLAFKSKADLKNTLPFSQNASSRLCQWQGVKCSQQKVVRLVLRDLRLGGVFAPNTLTRLDQLRVLGLQNTSLAGPIPDLSKLINLKSLFLDHNAFTGSFPLSVFSLHRVRILDLSYNNLTGPIPTRLASIDRLYYLSLRHNRFNGSVPPFNQSSLVTFNVSFNNLTGAIPATATLLRFGFSAFSSNPSLCGEIIHKECRLRSPFFGPSGSAVAPAPAASPLLPPPVALGQSEELHGVDFAQHSAKTKHKRTSMIIGFSSATFVLVGSLFCFVMAVKKKRSHKESKSKSKAVITESDGAGPMAAAAAMQIDQQENELEEKVRRVRGMQVGLVFCAGEAQLYTLDQLMRASAELLGRGSIGTTYKAVLDNRLIVCVKRLDAGKLGGTSKDDFEQHMASVGGLRHPNLVPLRAYFQAKEERLLIYDYQPNGSLFSLIHGSKSTRAKPLHWTSCLKIAEDVAQGLSYIHQAWRLVHGNLKSSNVLLGPDFEACVSDYCLTALAIADSLSEDDPDNAAYRAPELQNSSHQASSKSDVFSFGILLLELLTGKLPSQLPILMPNDLVNWVGSARDGDGGEDNRLEMLLEVAVSCSLTSPEQRPTMWQVLKMLQEIKETVSVENGELDAHIGLSS